MQIVYNSEGVGIQCRQSVDMIGHYADFATALSEYPEDSRGQLYRASGFLCTMLREKKSIAAYMNTLEYNLVLEASHAAVDYVTGTLPELDARMLVFESIGDPELISFDNLSTRALRSLNVQKIAHAIDHTARTGNVVLLSMANGAIPVSLMAFGGLQKEVRDRTTLYPVYYSRHKEEHVTPRLSIDESDWLLEQAQAGANFLVFDEDTATGSTVLGMMNFLKRYCGAKNETIRGVTVLRGGLSHSPEKTTRHALIRIGVEGLEYKDL